MKWTVLLYPDGKVKNIHPGPKYGAQHRNTPQFEIEAANFLEATRKADEERHLHRPVQVAPTPYRHPAFQTKGNPSEVSVSRVGRRPDNYVVPLGPVVRYCQCRAVLGPAENMCVVCKHEAEQAIKSGAVLEGLKPRTNRVNEAHLRILLEVRAQWLKCQTVGRFSAWLVDEIRRVETSPAPAPEPASLLEPAPV